MQNVLRFVSLVLTLLVFGIFAVSCAPATSGPVSSDTTSPLIDDFPGKVTDTSEADTTTPPVDGPSYIGYVNPLTGLPADKNFAGLRPAAIMVNNIPVSCPQEGISQADVIYECLVEGGYTRLMMLSMDYPSLDRVGSVRSTRTYYLDIAEDYDAILVHAGASTYAFDAMEERGTLTLNETNMYLPGSFYRDQNRMKKMGYEHSLMTTGEGIVTGINFKKYRSTTDVNFNYPVDFVDYGKTVSFDSVAEHVHIPLSHMQTTDFVYDAESEKYLRYQFSGKEHIDGSTGDILSFDNLILYFCNTGAISGDAKYRIDIETVGSGSGYYVTKGTYTPITWEKTAYNAPTRFYGADGEPLLLNTGNTFVTVCPTSIQTSVSLNYIG